MATFNNNFKVKNGLDASGVVTSTGLSLLSTTSPITLNGAAGTSGQMLTSAGTGATPTWTTPFNHTATQTANLFFAGPNSGGAASPTFRVLSSNDIYPAGPPSTFGQVIQYAPVGGGMAWSSQVPVYPASTATFSNAITFSAGAVLSGTTSLSPIRLPSGTVPTTVNQQFGMIAADAESIQLTTTKTTGAGPGFGLICAPQMVYAVANSGAATTTTGVSPFSASSDVLSSLESAKSYRFRGVYYFTSTFTSGTPTIQLLFTFSNAPVIFKYHYKTYRAAGQSTFDFVGHPTTNAATTVSAAVTSSISYVVEFEGFFTSNATLASTLTPQFRMSGTGVSTVATAGSFFQIEKLGTSTQTTIAGNWA